MKKLKEYLIDNKIFIEIAGILAAVSALFLAVPVNESDSYSEFIIGIDFLLISSFAVFITILFIKFLADFLKFLHTKQKDNLPLFDRSVYYILQVTFFIFSVVLIYNLFGYLFARYKFEFEQFQLVPIYIMAGILGFLLVFLIDGIVSLLFNLKKLAYREYLYTVYYIVPVLFFNDFLNYLIFNYDWQKTSFHVFIFTTPIFVLLDIIIYRSKYRS